MGTDQAESHTARKFRKISVCPAPVDVQVMLFSISSISILSSVVAMSVTSKGRPPRPCSRHPSPPLHLRAIRKHNAHSHRGTKSQLNHIAAGLNGIARGGGRGGGDGASRHSSGGDEREQ